MRSIKIVSHVSASGDLAGDQTAAWSE